MRTSLIDAITLNRQNVEIYTWAYHPCHLLPHQKEDNAFQTPHKLCVPTGSVSSPPEACVLLIQRDAVDGSTSQTHTGSNSTLHNALTGKCKHLMPNTHRGWTGYCSNNQKNFWKNMQILIQSCHSVKIDLGERPPVLWFRSSTIPLDLALNVCPR